jgi:hypothetical protein
MYTDPGFGSMIIQFVIAAIAASGAYFYIARKRIKAFIDKKRGKSASQEEK